MIRYSGNDQRLFNPVKLADKLRTDEEFLNLVTDVPWYDMSTLDPKGLAKLMQESKLHCEIIGYKRRCSRALGYYKGGKNIYINTAKLRRSYASIVGTIIHEWIHLLDAYDLDNYFGHGDNKPKPDTAPYKIGKIAKDLLVSRGF